MMPSSSNATPLKYLSGFYNDHVTEAETGAVPVGRNSPQKPALGLYPEQLSGSAFTMDRKNNLRSWLYRIKPSVVHGAYHKISNGLWRSATDRLEPTTPMQLRWNPLPSSAPNETVNFVEGVVTFATNGDFKTKSGSAVHLYQCNKDMIKEFFCNADGDLLIVPQQGQLYILTEFGQLLVEPSEIVLIPRGVKFQIRLPNKAANGYICEIFGAHFELPNLGPIGANGLASARDFEFPIAWYEDRPGDFVQIMRFSGQNWAAAVGHSPLDVVGWHGNYAPCKYDLKRFNTINTVSFDHPDPSIFTVLTSPSGTPGQANVDFVIFPPRWMVAEDTFRPPYYHRNIMSEFMGLIEGVYDAKTAGGFEPGGASLHNCMQAHGPDADAFLAAREQELKPTYLQDTLAFMFESCWIYHPTEFAVSTAALQSDYTACWQKIPKLFSST